MAKNDDGTSGNSRSRSSQATEYVVLEQRELKDDEGNTVVAWVEHSHGSGTSRLQVAKEAAGKHEGERFWRPVPTRNWGESAIETHPQTTTSMVAHEAPPF